MFWKRTRGSAGAIIDKSAWFLVLTTLIKGELDILTRTECDALQFMVACQDVLCKSRQLLRNV